MKKITALLICFSMLLLFSSCNEVNAAFFRKVARESFDDGWVYTFVYEDLKDEQADDSSICKYSFFGMNLRYRYDKTSASQLDNVQFSFQSFGEGSDAQAEDMILVKKILDYSLSVEELLALNPDDYEFKELDKDLFFRLMRTALTGEPQKEAEDLLYWDKPSYAFLWEPDYTDGYRFQIAFLQETGCVDEIYIDVLYKTGDGAADYVQLSDLVEKGEATAEQKKAFDKIKEIVSGIKENELYIFNAEEYKDLMLGDIDFSRLYTFLDNIHNNKFDNYK